MEKVVLYTYINYQKQKQIMNEPIDSQERDSIDYKEAVDLLSSGMSIDENILLENPSVNFTNLETWVKCINTGDVEAVKKDLVVEISNGENENKIIDLSSAKEVKNENEKVSAKDILYSILLTDAKLNASNKVFNISDKQVEDIKIKEIMEEVFPALGKEIDENRKYLRDSVNKIILNKNFDENQQLSLKDLTQETRDTLFFNKSRILLPSLLPIILSASIGLHVVGNDMNRYQPIEDAKMASQPVEVVAAMPTSYPETPIYHSTSTPVVSEATMSVPTEQKTYLSPAEKQKESVSEEQKVFLMTHEFNKGDKSKNEVMMTYDDGGGVGSMKDIMNAYDSYGAKTTFFVPGVWLEKNKDFAKEIIDRGFEIGCHGWDHADMSKLSPIEVEKQISDFINTMSEVDPNYKIKYIRFPYGARTDNTKEIAAEYGLQSVMWGDESGGTTDQTLNYIMRYLGRGTIVLSHSTREFDVSMVREILKSIHDTGYKPVTISEGMDPENVWK